MQDHVTQRQDGGALWVTLNRAECGNLITTGMVNALKQAMLSVSADTKLIVLAANGDDFCKGRDYSAAPEDAKNGKKPSTLEIYSRMTKPIIEFYAAIKNTPVPTLAVVQGAATGFGCAMSCACDIVLASDRARFSLPEMHERGLPPTLAMTALFDRIDRRALTYLVFASEAIGAEAARACGLASEIVPHSDLQTRAAALSAHICSQPADSIRAVKNYLSLAPNGDATGRAALGSTLYAMVAGSR